MWDPFYSEMPEFFGMKLPELLKLKDPTAWPDFERGEISEEELYQNFFKDRRPVNGPALLHQMVGPALERICAQLLILIFDIRCPITAQDLTLPVCLRLHFLPVEKHLQGFSQSISFPQIAICQFVEQLHSCTL